MLLAFLDKMMLSLLVHFFQLWRATIMRMVSLSLPLFKEQIGCLVRQATRKKQVQNSYLFVFNFIKLPSFQVYLINSSKIFIEKPSHLETIYYGRKSKVNSNWIRGIDYICQWRHKCVCRRNWEQWKATEMGNAQVPSIAIIKNS